VDSNHESMITNVGLGESQYAPLV